MIFGVSCVLWRLWTFSQRSSSNRSIMCHPQLQCQYIRILKVNSELFNIRFSYFVIFLIGNQTFYYPIYRPQTYYPQPQAVNYQPVTAPYIHQNVSLNSAAPHQDHHHHRHPKYQKKHYTNNNNRKRPVQSTIAVDSVESWEKECRFYFKAHISEIF